MVSKPLGSRWGGRVEAAGDGLGGSFPQGPSERFLLGPGRLLPSRDGAHAPPPPPPATSSCGRTSGQQMLAQTLAGARDKGSGNLLPARQSWCCRVQAALPLLPGRDDPPGGWQRARSPPARHDAQRGTPSTGSDLTSSPTAKPMRRPLHPGRLPLTQRRHEASLESHPSAARSASCAHSPSGARFGLVPTIRASPRLSVAL